MLLVLMTVMTCLGEGYSGLLILSLWAMSEQMQTMLLLGTSWSSLLVLMSSLTMMMALPAIYEQTLHLLLLSTTMLSCMFFLSTSSMLMWSSFETSVMPLLLALLIYTSQSEAMSAAFYLLSYSLISGLPLLMMIVLSTNLESSWTTEELSGEASMCLTLAFLVKLPCYTLHLWLPLAHVEAPTAGSMILAAIMLKAGTLGLLKVMNTLPLPVLILSLIGSVVCPLITLSQSDAKSLIAYSSVAHMSTFLLSLFLLSVNSVESSSILQMAHGFVSSALFLVVGSLSHMIQSRMLYFMSSENHTTLTTLCALNSGAPLSLPFLAESLFYSHLTTLGLTAMALLTSLALSVTYYSFYLLVSLTSNKENSLKSTTNMVCITVMVLSMMQTLLLL